MINCSNLHMTSNMSREIKEPKMGVGNSDICEKYSLRLNFCTIPVSMNKRLNICTVRDHSTAVSYAECNLEEF